MNWPSGRNRRTTIREPDKSGNRLSQGGDRGEGGGEGAEGKGKGFFSGEGNGKG